MDTDDIGCLADLLSDSRGEKGAAFSRGFLREDGLNGRLLRGKHLLGLFFPAQQDAVKLDIEYNSPL